MLIHSGYNGHGVLTINGNEIEVESWEIQMPDDSKGTSGCPAGEPGTPGPVGRLTQEERRQVVERMAAIIRGGLPADGFYIRDPNEPIPGEDTQMDSWIAEAMRQRGVEPGVPAQPAGLRDRIIQLIENWDELRTPTPIAGLVDRILMAMLQARSEDLMPLLAGAAPVPVRPGYDVEHLLDVIEEATKYAVAAGASTPVGKLSENYGKDTIEFFLFNAIEIAHGNARLEAARANRINAELIAERHRRGLCGVSYLARPICW